MNSYPPHRSEANPWPLIVLVSAILLMILSACSKTVGIAPPPPPPVVAQVAVPVPCKVEKIDKPERPKKLASPLDDLWTAARLIVADHMVLEAYTSELEAALDRPCVPEDQ